MNIVTIQKAKRVPQTECFTLGQIYSSPFLRMELKAKRVPQQKT